MLSIHFLLHSEPARFRNVGELSRIAKLLDTGREERKMHPPAEHASQCQMLDGDVQSRVRNWNEFCIRLPTGIETFFRIPISHPVSSHNRIQISFSPSLFNLRKKDADPWEDAGDTYAQPTFDPKGNKWELSCPFGYCNMKVSQKTIYGRR